MAVNHSFEWAPAVGCYDRPATGHGLQRHDAKVLPGGRVHHRRACRQQGPLVSVTAGGHQPHLLRSIISSIISASRNMCVHVWIVPANQPDRAGYTMLMRSSSGSAVLCLRMCHEFMGS